jgi:hypothetical protein
MILVIQLAAAIALAYFVVRGIARFSAWRATRRVRVRILRLDDYPR